MQKGVDLDLIALGATIGVQSEKPVTFAVFPHTFLHLPTAGWGARPNMPWLGRRRRVFEGVKVKVHGGFPQHRYFCHAIEIDGPKRCLDRRAVLEHSGEGRLIPGEAIENHLKRAFIVEAAHKVDQIVVEADLFSLMTRRTQ
jgi:hypothetical protein